jgi:hypothetical protein
MIGFAESEDIGALPPQPRFAGCVLSVKAIALASRHHRESGHPGFDCLDLARAGMTRRPPAVQPEARSRETSLLSGGLGRIEIPTLEATERKIIYATFH